MSADRKSLDTSVVLRLLVGEPATRCFPESFDVLKN